jgi:hypothetical protein
MDCCVLDQIMALVCVANVSANQNGQVMRVIVERLASPVSLQAVEKFAQAMETANVGLANVMKEKKAVTQENSVRSFQ